MIPLCTLVIAMSLLQAQAPAPAVGRLAGRVTVEGTNAPLADARVILMPMLGRVTPPQRPMIPMGGPPQAITDQDGRFAFPQLRPGEYRIEVQRTGYAPLDADGGRGRTIHVVEGQSAEV